MNRFRLKLLGLSLAASLCFGCEAPAPKSVSMRLDAVNTADRILVVEGSTDLPSGARLKARLVDRDDKVLMRDEAVVRSGHFFFDFGLDGLSEFSAYRVLVTFDPERAPLAVRQYTGLWGEALQGPGVREASGRRIYQAEHEILLSASAQGREWEGRDFARMEVSERSRVLGKLERWVEQNEGDKVAKLALARAYLAIDPLRENAEGSRAHQLLLDAARVPDEDKNGQLARELLAGIKAEEQKAKLAARTKKALAKGGRYRTDFQVEPGKKLGGFRLGSPYQVVVRFFKLNRAADFSKGTEDQVVTLKDFHHLHLTYGIRSRRLIAARTTSKKFRLPEGLGVGSLLQEFQKEYGTDAVYTPEFSADRTEPNGTKYLKGVVVTSGLELEIERKIDPEFGIPVDKVKAMTVFQRGR